MTDTRPALEVTASGCDLGATGLACTVTLRAAAPVHWSATVGEPLSIWPSSGSLAPGETVTVTVTLHPATPRTGGDATVTITGGGRTHTVPVSWEGATDTTPTPTPTPTVTPHETPAPDASSSL